MNIKEFEISLPGACPAPIIPHKGDQGHHYPSSKAGQYYTAVR